VDFQPYNGKSSTYSDIDIRKYSHDLDFEVRFAFKPVETSLFAVFSTKTTEPSFLDVLGTMMSMLIFYLFD
jgi:hypothetical protein